MRYIRQSYALDLVSRVTKFGMGTCSSFLKLCIYIHVDLEI